MSLLRGKQEFVLLWWLDWSVFLCNQNISLWYQCGTSANKRQTIIQNIKWLHLRAVCLVFIKNRRIFKSKVGLYNYKQNKNSLQLCSSELSPQSSSPSHFQRSGIHRWLSQRKSPIGLQVISSAVQRVCQQNSTR